MFSGSLIKTETFAKHIFVDEKCSNSSLATQVHYVTPEYE